MLDGTSRLTLAEDVSYQSLGPDEDTVVLSLSTGYLYTCNETARAFLKAVDGRRTFNQIVDALEEEFEVERERLRSDMSELASELIREGLLIAETDTD